LTKILWLVSIPTTTVASIPLTNSGPLKLAAVAGPHESVPIKPANETKS